MTTQGLRRAYLISISFIMAGLVVMYLLHNDILPREAAFMAGIFVVAALLWTTEALPLFATSLLVIVLQITFLANPGNWPGLGFAQGATPPYQKILSMAADPVILLFFGGFLLARAAEKEGVDQTLITTIIRPFDGQPKRVLFGLMAVTALLSMWMSNTATTALMIALIGPVLLRIPAGDPFRRALVLGIPFAANIGGIGTPIGSPPNAVALGFLQARGIHVSFLGWMAVALPLMALLLVFTWFVLSVRFRPKIREFRFGSDQIPLTKRGKLVMVIFGITVLLWLTDALHQLPTAVVAMLPAVLLTMTGILDRRDINGLEWDILILIAGGITLGGGVAMTGLDTWLVTRLLANGQGLMAILALLILATFALSNFMSHTAAVNLILPIGLSFAATMGLSPAFKLQTALGIALISSCSMLLPISTPPNAIAYGRGELVIRDMAVPGLFIGLIALILITFGIGPIIGLWQLGS